MPGKYLSWWKLEEVEEPIGRSRRTYHYKMFDFILFQCFGGFFSALSSQVLSWQIFGRFPVAVQSSDFVPGHCRKQGYVGNLPCKDFTIAFSSV